MIERGKATKGSVVRKVLTGLSCALLITAVGISQSETSQPEISQPDVAARQASRQGVVSPSSFMTPYSVLAFGQKKQPKAPVFEPEMLELINKLSVQPELMNVQYLRWVLGSPENERSQLAMVAKNYYWYAPLGHKCIFELHQNGPERDVITQSSFTVHVQKSQITTKEMEKAFGDDHKRVFDTQAYPVDVYSTAPYTCIACTQPHDSFRVEKIQVHYDGPPLPPPSKLEILNAYNDHKERVLAVSQSKQGAYTHDAIPWLEREARYRPQDPNVHLELARAYRSNLMMNEAITEYGTAARLAGDDYHVVDQCRQALIEMKVLPPSSSSGAGTAPPVAPKRTDKRSYLVQGSGANGGGAGL